MRAHGALVELLDRRRGPAGPEFVCLHLAHRLLHPAGRVRDEVLVRPTTGGGLAETGTTALADRGAERLPHLLDPPDEIRGRARESGIDLPLVLREMFVGLADDQPGRQEVDLTIGHSRHQIDDTLICLVKPLHDFVGGPRRTLRGLTRVFSIDVHDRAAPSLEAVRQLLGKVPHPVRDVAEHRLVRPAGRRRVRQRVQTQSVRSAPERTPALAQLRKQLGRPLRHCRENLVEMLGVVAVGVSGDDRDHLVVIRVDLLGGELSDFLDDPRMRGFELHDDLARVAAARPLDHGRIELVGVVDAEESLRFALAELPQALRGPILPGGRVRDEILVCPARGRLLFETGAAYRGDREAEGDPRRLHDAEKIGAATHRCADVGVVVGVMARRVPLDDVERELVGVVRDRAHRLQQPRVCDGPAREDLVRRRPPRVLGDALVESVDIVVELGILAALQHGGDTLRDCLLPGREMSDVLVEAPAGAELLAEPLAGQGLERQAEGAMALADAPEQVDLRNNRGRGTHRTPPSAQVPARRRLRLLARTRGTWA